MSKRRKNAGEGYGYMFHGAFAKKADAVAKEQKTKGAWVKGTPTNRGYRYLVMSPRTNPRKRKNVSLEETKAKAIAAYKKLEHLEGRSDSARAYRMRLTLARLNKRLGWTMAQVAEMARAENSVVWGKKNPMDLVVMGANPGAREIVVQPGERVTFRVNPERSSSSDDSPYMRQAAHDLFGKSLEQLTARELSQVAMLAAKIKLGQRENSVGAWLGWAPAPPGSRSERAAHRREFRARVKQQAKEMRDEYGRLRRSARASFKDKKKLERLFHEVYGQNPTETCGKMIGGYPCTLKPHHRGPCLPQGATLRPRSRHNWGPRGNPSADSIREDFTGMPVDRVTTYREDHMPAGNYALLGKVLALYVKPVIGGQVQVIKPTGTLVTSDESARQLWFVGGDQDISEALPRFGAIDRGAGIFELGELRRIDYKQRKEHVPDPELDEWRHELGEETGVLPKVLFDANHKRLLLEGGEYRVRPEGIVN